LNRLPTTTAVTTPQRVISLGPSLAGRFPGRIGAALVRAADSLLGLRAMQRIYDRCPAGKSPAEFVACLLDALQIEARVAAADLDLLPDQGPVVVVANHPFGGIEGLLLARLLLERRSDVRILANYMLDQISELRELFLAVDPFETPGAAGRNLAPMRRAMEWLGGGGALVVFPAGEVSRFDPRSRRIEDAPWNPAIARIVRRIACPVVPVHFDGRNRLRFHALGLIHPMLRTALLPRELLARRGHPVHVRVGSLVPARRLAGFDDDRDAIDYLRGRTTILAERRATPSGAITPIQPRVTPQQTQPIIPAVSVEAMERELAALPNDRLLVDGEDQVVYVAEAERIPQLLREVGRLREISFRVVGEGTGRELDLDEFDPAYLHLFIWSRADRAVVGAYRLGMTDRLIASRGARGLYTSTLFNYRSDLFRAMGPSLEMGRSFIRPEYQKSYAGLVLLWKGIGEFVVRNPQYGTLFGPVSISADYQSASQRLIVAFLSKNRFAHEWSSWVRPRSPHRPDRRTTRRLQPLQLKDLDDVSTFISEIEADHKGVPILLKQYLKLGGRLLGFNVDPEFSNVLDVLIMVDLRRTSPKILRRYMGREGTASFLACHHLAGRSAG
jgi:putative hemolysin